MAEKAPALKSSLGHALGSFSKDARSAALARSLSVVSGLAESNKVCTSRATAPHNRPSQDPCCCERFVTTPSEEKTLKRAGRPNLKRFLSGQTNAVSVSSRRPRALAFIPFATLDRGDQSDDHFRPSARGHGPIRR